MTPATRALRRLVRWAAPFVAAACAGSEAGSAPDGGGDGAVTVIRARRGRRRRRDRDRPGRHVDAVPARVGGRAGPGSRVATVSAAARAPLVRRPDRIRRLRRGPEVARSYELFGPDSASLRYHLRGDVRWSDGRSVTAHDAAWTLESRGDVRTASPRMSQSEHIRAIEVEDDSTLVVHFTRRYAEMLEHTSGLLVPRHVFEGTDLSTIRSHPAITDPTGGARVVSGPYRISAWRRGQSFVLTPNPVYRPAPAFVRRLTFVVIPDGTTRIIELETGGADAMEVPAEKVGQLAAAAPHLRVVKRERRALDYLSYNSLAHPALADPAARRALGLAIDRGALIAGLGAQGFAEPAGGPYPSVSALYDSLRHAPLPFDPGQASRILDERGWRRGPDGVRAKGNDALRFTLTTYAR